MEELRIFENAEFGQIRTVEVDGKTYFVGSDVAKALGYARPNDAVSAHCRSTVKHRIATTQGNMSEMVIIPEGDMYRLITHSKLETAQKFESWVFDEVLPSIRKHGMYAVEELLNDPDLAIKAFTALKEEKEKNKVLIEENTNMKPKAEYFDALVEKKLNTNIRDTATELHVKERWFTKWLIENGYCYRTQTFDGKTGALRPKSQYKDTDDGKGLFTVKDAHNPNCNWAGQQMLITPKGKETFRLLLESEEVKYDN